MSFTASKKRPSNEHIGVLRAAAALIALGGAVGSLCLLWRAGQRTPRFLLAVMTMWVLAPFVALIVADVASKRWSAVARATLHAVMVIVGLASLAVYGTGVLRPQGAPAGFLFVLVPLSSLVLGAIAILIAAFVSDPLRRRAAD